MAKTCLSPVQNKCDLCSRYFCGDFGCKICWDNPDDMCYGVHKDDWPRGAHHYSPLKESK